MIAPVGHVLVGVDMDECFPDAVDGGDPDGTDQPRARARYANAVRRWSGGIADTDGEPPPDLLDELASIADEHAASQQPDGRRKVRASVSATEP